VSHQNRVPADRVSVVDVLAARMWMLGALSSDVVAAPPALAETAWREGLRRERCAAPLKARVRGRGDWDALPVELVTVLEEHAARELQRILMARAQLLEIDRLAAAHGLDVIVLKGGVAALADARAVDLIDVDVLAVQAEARTLAGLLDQAGYAGEGFSSTQHLHGRARGGQLEVEVHQQLDVGDCSWSATVWERAVPIAGTSRLRQLAPEDHLWHLLYHVGVQHPDRRGAVRDTLLTSYAIADCSVAALDAVATRIDVMPQRRALHDLLTMAGELAERRTVRDRFVRMAAAMFVVRRAGPTVPLAGVPVMAVGSWATALLCGWPEIRHQLGRVGMRTLGASTVSPLARIERRAPRLGRALRVCARLVRLPLAVALAFPLAAAAAVTSWRATRSCSW